VKILIAVAWRARLRDTKLWTLRRSPWGTRLDLGEEEIVAHARRSKVMTLQGWGLRSERLLQKHAVTIRQHLRPLPEVEDRVQQLIPKAASNADALIGVHVRRTDYAEWCRGRFFFGADVYQRVVDQMAGLFPGKKVAFLVTSDDLDEASLIRGETVTLARGSLLEDLFSLAECDYIVGPPSTFSYWASFYGSTPLYPIVDPDKEILLEDFAVAPEFADADLEEPFWPDQWTERPELT
jgi:hypothetical protein